MKYSAIERKKKKGERKADNNIRLIRFFFDPLRCSNRLIYSLVHLIISNTFSLLYNKQYFSHRLHYDVFIIVENITYYNLITQQ